MTTPTESPADTIRSEANARYESIRSNPRASALAIKTDIAEVYLAAKAKMATYQQSAVDAASRTHQADMRMAFGVPNDPASAMSYRDACDRTATISAAPAARQLLDRAIATNDTLLARAVGLRAFDLCLPMINLFGYTLATDTGDSWGDVLQAYADFRGDTIAEAINRLLQTVANRTTPGDPFAGYLPTPPEVYGLQPYEMQALVDQRGVA